MTHGHHDKPRRILGDDCDECVGRSKNIEGLVRLDPFNIHKLARLAAELHGRGPIDTPPPGFSHADIRAIDNLRLAGRLVFASGITSEVADGRTDT